MNAKDLQTVYANHEVVLAVSKGFANDANKKIAVSGMFGSSAAMIMSAAWRRMQRCFVVVTNDADEAAYLCNDLVGILSAQRVLFYPSAYKRSILYDQPHQANILMQTEVLNMLNAPNPLLVVVTYPEALVERIVTHQSFSKSLLELQTGAKVSPEFVIEIMNEYSFERTDFVYEPGQYSVRGSIIDIFSYSHTDPYRIDFFGTEVESIRTFDTETQLSKEIVDQVCIVPNIQIMASLQTEYTTLLQYLPNTAVLWTKDLQYCIEQMNLLSDSVLRKYDGDPNFESMRRKVCSGTAMSVELEPWRVVEYGTRRYYGTTPLAEAEISLQPLFQKNFELLANNLRENQAKKYETLFFTDNQAQIGRLEEIFSAIDTRIRFTGIGLSLHEGFIDHHLKLCCYTDHQVFERYHKHRVASKLPGKEALSLRELTSLQPGDYVVHIDHGIGRFAGLSKIEVNGKWQEAIKLNYENSDTLFVSIHNLHKIAKYKGKDDTPPKMHKLGSGVWQRIKQTTKAKVKDIAKDLIALYADRKSRQGFAFSADTYMQQELEASFFYEDTPDQLKATQAVKRAMERVMPMDMLVCGDVGFGKTEVAIRAAFKAVSDNKQVAVLVPTTILALQHYKTFSSRLKNFPVTVDFVNRFKTPKQQKETLQRVAEGKVDILIGTHRLVSKDVQFKDLGLLIIDEEQKFGVSTKEKLRQFRTDVDTLTLTATPIPRTLQFSLMGARDLAVINTPPPNRHPILTEAHAFNEDIIREAIVQELERDGQVFFINNRVNTLPEIYNLIGRICPGARCIIGHGQMEGDQLEKLIIAFVNGEYDVLISTTIIEAGIDIPNANTMIINDAQNFGLSDLHQLRGRVGRSNKKAFCYLLTPPPQILTAEARRRLQALEEFSELGSGINIAMQDLDIRGAGNILGAEQSGFITDIGYETYQKILAEAMQELKEGEYRALYADSTLTDDTQAERSKASSHQYVMDCQIDSDFALLLPDSYVSSTTERIRLYKELDSLDNEAELKEFETNMRDRFGVLPVESKALLDIVRLRWLASRLGFERVMLKSGRMVNSFIANQQSPYFQTDLFGKIIAYLKDHHRFCSMQQKNDKLTLQFENVNSPHTALKLLRNLASFCGLNNETETE